MDVTRRKLSSWTRELEIRRASQGIREEEGGRERDKID